MCAAAITVVVASSGGIRSTPGSLSVLVEIISSYPSKLGAKIPQPRRARFLGRLFGRHRFKFDTCAVHGLHATTTFATEQCEYARQPAQSADAWQRPNVCSRSL